MAVELSLECFSFLDILKKLDSLIVDTGRYVTVFRYLTLQGLKTFESSFMVIDTTNKPYVETGTSVAESNTVV